MKSPFEKKLNKLNRKQNTCWNYATRCGGNLTEGFWDNHGCVLQEMLDDMQNNHYEEWSEYCKNKGICPDYNVGDAMA